MKVTLLASYTDETIAHKAAAICVDKYDTASKTNLDSAIASKHFSVLEHLPMTFLITDVSRALTHQLVRHRIASYSQQSQRYAKVHTNNMDWFITPDSIKNSTYEFNICNTLSKTPKDIYIGAMKDIAEIYDKLIEAGIPKEDARMVLPNACYSKIVITDNARAFIEQCEKRLCHKAQWEIQEMFKQMREAIKEIYPTVYKLAVPNCVNSTCTEAKPCGVLFK